MGGSNIGLMGQAARTGMDSGIKVTSVITKQLAKTVEMLETTEIIICEDMHTRKKTMFEQSDAFIALPGGFGTLEEMFEVITWLQLALHEKPIAIFNICNYYNKLIDFLKNTVENGFLRKEHLDMIILSDKPEVLLDKMYEFEVPNVLKWWD